MRAGRKTPRQGRCACHAGSATSGLSRRCCQTPVVERVCHRNPRPDEDSTGFCRGNHRLGRRLGLSGRLQGVPSGPASAANPPTAYNRPAGSGRGRGAGLGHGAGTAPPPYPVVASGTVPAATAGHSPIAPANAVGAAAPAVSSNPSGGVPAAGTTASSSPSSASPSSSSTSSGGPTRPSRPTTTPVSTGATWRPR